MSDESDESDDITDEDFSDGDMINFVATGRLTRCDFSRAVLKNSVFDGAVLEDCSFVDALIGSATFLRCRFVRCDFSGAIGVRAEFIDCTFEDTVKPAAA